MNLLQREKKKKKKRVESDLEPFEFKVDNFKRLYYQLRSSRGACML